MLLESYNPDFPRKDPFFESVSVDQTVHVYKNDHFEYMKIFC